jgi:hypothetical protein
LNVKHHFRCFALLLYNNGNVNNKSFYQLNHELSDAVNRKINDYQLKKFFFYIKQRCNGKKPHLYFALISLKCLVDKVNSSIYALNVEVSNVSIKGGKLKPLKKPKKAENFEDEVRTFRCILIRNLNAFF